MERVTRPQAEAIAFERLREYIPEIQTVVVEGDDLEGVGWIFNYEAKAFRETGDIGEALVGNAPIIVDFTGEVHEPMSGESLDEYVAKLRESFGSLNVPPSRGETKR